MPAVRRAACISRSLGWDLVVRTLSRLSSQRQAATETKCLSQHLLAIAKLLTAAFVMGLVLFSLPRV